MLEGIIIKGIGGFYYVKVDGVIYECRARGLFRKEKITPQVGDSVLIRISSEDNSGYVEKILPRKSELSRPPVANVNQAIIVFALKAPDPNLWLLDRFLLLAAHEKLDIVICINKVDLVTKNEVDEIFNIYANAGYKIISTSSKTGEGMDQLRDVLSRKISVFAGPSGVGKSTLLNNIQPNLKLKTGDVSEKTSRGKHTTRHAELMELEAGGLVVDTPGFSSLDINFVDQADLEKYFNEIYELSHLCRFNGCKHYKEPSCAVKDAVEEGQISRWRYENYIRFLEEIKSIRRY